MAVSKAGAAGGAAAATAAEMVGAEVVDHQAAAAAGTGVVKALYWQALNRRSATTFGGDFAVLALPAASATTLGCMQRPPCPSLIGRLCTPRCAAYVVLRIRQCCV